MKFSNNNLLLFLSTKDKAYQLTEVIKKKYPVERNNLIESASAFSDAEDILRRTYKKEIYFDIIVIDLKIPLGEREDFIKIITGQQYNHQFIMVSYNTKLVEEEEKFIKDNKVHLIYDFDEIPLFSFLEAIFEKRFNEKKYNLINRIDDIVNLKVDSQEILNQIALNTLGNLNLKTCWISLVDYESEKLKIGAITGFGEFEEEYMKNFDISLSDSAVTIESIINNKQVEYENVLAENCPFKYKDFARKMGLKSILVTPIIGRAVKDSEKVVGTLNLYTYFPHKFQDDELELARIIAAKIAVVLSMKGVYERERDDTRKKLELIEKVAAEINRNFSDYKTVFTTIVDEGIKLVQAHRGCIKIYDKNREYITREYPDYCENLQYRNEKLREQDITSYVIKNTKSIIIPDIDSCEYKDPALKYKNYGSRISVPLWSDKDVIGVLTAEHDDKNYFNEHHLLLFEALAKHAAIAIENAKRYKQLKKRVDSQLIIRKLIEETSKLEAIENEMMREKYRIDQLDRVIKDAIQNTGEIFAAKSGFIVLTEFNSNYAVRNNRWRLDMSTDDLPDLEIGIIENGETIFKKQQSITGKVIAEGRLYNCRDVSKDTFYLKYGQNDKTKSEIVIPLKFQNQTFGAFALDSNEENAFSKDDEEILKSIATQMALLIKRFAYLNKLLDLNKPFNKIDNLDQLYDEIISLTAKFMETNVCYLRVLNRNQLVIKGKTGLEWKNDTLPLKIGEGIAGTVASTLKPKIIENVQTSYSGYKYKDFAKENNLFAMLCVPIVSVDMTGNKDLIGVLNIYANRICNFTSMDLQLMLSIAEKAGEAIKKARLIKQLDSIAKVDEVLTTTSERGFLKDFVNIAKDLLDADQVVLYQYNSNIRKNFGFLTPATTAGDFRHEKFKSQAQFTKDSLLVLLLEEKMTEFFVESYEEGLIKKIYENKLKISDIKPFYQREELKSVIIFKLIYKEEVVGILFINYRYHKSFSQEEKQIAKTFANKAAIAISNIRKYEDIDRLHDVGNTITSESDIEKILKIIAEKVKLTLRADSVIFYKYNSKKKEIISPHISMGNLNDNHAMEEGGYNEENVQFRVIRHGHDVFASNVKQNNIFGSGEDWDLGQKKIPRFIVRENIQSCAAMLLKVKNRIVGLMFINYKGKQKFDPQQKRIIKIFANQAAITLRNADLIEESKQAVNRIKDNLAAIQQSGNAIVKNLRKTQIEIQDILRPTLDKAMKLINVDMGYIGVIKKEKEKMKILVCSERYKKLKDKLVDYIYESSEWVKTHKRFDIHSKNKRGSDYKTFFENPHLFADYQDLDFTEDRNIQSALRVPIYSSDKELLAMIILESEKEGAFSDNDAYTVVSLANQASLALQNYKLILQLKKLRKIDTEILKEQNDSNKVLDVILKASLDLVKKKHADIKLLMENGDLIIKKSYSGREEGRIIKVKYSLSGIAIESKKTYYESDVLKNARFLETPGVKTKSALVIPLIVDTKPIGVLNIESEKFGDFTDENITVLEMLSGQAAIAIQLAQQKDKLIEKEKEANIGYVTRESVHWVGNKIGPISRSASRMQEKLVEHFNHNITNDKIFESLLKDLDLIKKGAESALSIKSDLIDVGKKKEKFDLIELLNHCIANFRKENNTIEVTVKSQTISCPYEIIFKSTVVKTFWVNLDKSHIERMFHYVIKNAYQAIEDRIINPFTKHDVIEGKIDIIAQKIKSGLEIVIKDNGCGIPEENKNDLFRPFFTTKGADRGSGVGLWFCKRTMEGYRGKIFLKDKETASEIGATFCLYFPQD